jgi:signal transduction histidine kinase
MIGSMRPTDAPPWWWFTGDSGTAPVGPAMTTLRSVVARLASLTRGTGIVYVVVQIAIWHSFYAADPWRLTGPVAAAAWATVVTAYLRRRWPTPLFVCLDTAVYVALALGAQACVAPTIRGAAFSWLLISMWSQLIVPAWYAPAAFAVPLALASPLAYFVGAERATGTASRTMTAAAILLVMAAGVHIYVRRQLYRRAAAADAALAEADRAAGEQFVVLSRNIERREHERLLHDTVLNTLTALARAGRDDVAEVVARCRQDVALIQRALSGPGEEEADTGRAYGDVVRGVRAVAAQASARGLQVHLDIDGGEAPAFPAPVTVAISNAVREALSNVAAHAGTGEAWVKVSLIAPNGTPGRLQVTVRDTGIGFDPVSVDQTRLGLRRSIAERMTDCGGHASVWSEPGRGAVVRLSWSAPPEPGAAEPSHAEPSHAAPADRILARENSSW